MTILCVLALTLGILPLSAGASGELRIITDDDGTYTDNVEVVERLTWEGEFWEGSTEVDYDGERYVYIGQFNGVDDRGQRPDQGGMFIVDLLGDEDEGIAPYTVVGKLNCPGTDNYVRYMDPEVFSYTDGGGEFVVMAHHGNQCSGVDPEAWDSSDEFSLMHDPNTTPGHGAFNGITVIDVTDKTAPRIVSTIGHVSAHTVMPHPTQPYLFILPGGLPTNGTNVGQRSIAPTAIIDASDPTDLRYVGRITHNASGCHDFGFNSDGSVGFCAGFGEVSTWDLSDIENPLVLGRIHNPAIQFAHNVVISDDDRFLVINDEAFGFHTCNQGEAVDLYGSMWIYDISINPHLPILAGRVAPPGHPDSDVNVADWVRGWCAAHNYNFIPGTHILVSSWFAGGMTAHDISDPLNPELLALYQPNDGVMWSAHYYGGYLISGDMIRGSEIVRVDGLEEAAEQARTARTSGLQLPRLGASKDLTATLIPSVLPSRPARPLGGEGGFCVLPGRGSLGGR